MKFLKAIGLSLILGIILGQFGHSHLEAYVVGWLGGLICSRILK